LHPRKPTEQEIAAGPLAHYSLTRLQAVPIGPVDAFVTYAAEVVGTGASPVTVQYAVCELWEKSADE
jgi:hypothetical protein